MQILFFCEVVLLALCLGSFVALGVVRIPRGESIVRPRSHCRSCEHQLAWYENIPLLSFFLARGRCSACGKGISAWYPVIEAVTVAVLVLAYVAMPLPRFLVYTFAFFTPMLLLFWIDLRDLILPDAITLPGIVVGAVVHVLDRVYFKVPFVGLKPNPSIVQALLESGLGAVLGFAILALIAWLYWKLRKRVGMGAGDWKLAAMLGAYFGWQGFFFILMLASVTGAVLGAVYLFVFQREKDAPLPFGSFLTAAAMIFALYGNALVRTYLGWFR